MNRQIFKLILCISLFSFPIKSSNPDQNNICSESEPVKEEQKRFFWSDNTTSIETKSLITIVDRILELTNHSLKLKIESEAFKSLIVQLNDQVKKIEIDLKSKDKLQKTIISLISYISKYPKSNSDLISLCKILDKTNLSKDK